MKILIFFILFYIFNNMFLVYGDNIVVVKGGVLQDGVELIKKWDKGKGFLSCYGEVDILASSYRVKSTNFKITAKLSINLDGTAAGVKINDNIFGLDGGNNHGPFMEGPAFANASGGKGLIVVSPAQQYIKDNIPFKLEIAVDKNHCKFSIDNNVVWQGAINFKGEQCVIALRPQRALMKVYDFEVDGMKSGKLSPESGREICLITPVDSFPKSIQQNIEISLPGNENKKNVTVELRSRNNNTLLLDFPVAESTNRIVIGGKRLVQAYEKCTINYNMRPILCTVKNNGEIIDEQILNLYDPNKEMDFPLGEIVNKIGYPEAYINGHSSGILRGFVALNQVSDRYLSSSVRQFYHAGVNDFIIWVRPSRFTKDGIIDKTQVYNYIVAMISRIVADAPKSNITIYWQLYMTKEWCKSHPSELIQLDVPKQTLQNAPGRYLQPSYASELWRHDAGDFLRKMLKMLKKSPVGDRISAIKLAYANCGEWNHWGYHEKAFVDFSKPMQRAFALWLQAKYKTQDKLRQAWADNDISFNSKSLIPSRTKRMSFQNGLLRIVPKAQSTIDYYQFFQEMTVDTIEYYAKIIKESSENRLLVGTFYGYYFAHLTGQPYHFQDSGHYALARLLRSPYIDFLGGPYPYASRRQNAVVGGIYSSVALHGKLWESEGDQRTHRSKENQRYFGKTDSLSESIAIAKRDFMMNMSKHGSYYFFDFIRGWYQDSEFMDTVSRLRKIDRFSQKTGSRTNAQVAVFVSERNIPWIGCKKNHGLTLFRYMFTHFMDMAGAPWELYLMSDLKNVDISKFKIVIFANVFKVEDDQLKYIKTVVRNNDRTVIFLWAPGIIANNGLLDVNRSWQMTGIKIGVKPDAEFRRLNSSLPNDKLYLHVHHKYNGKFMTYIDDHEAIELARFEKSGLPGAAMKNFSNHRSILFCFPGLNAAYLRRFYIQSGVHVWNKRSYDKLYTAGPFVALFSSNKGGEKELRLPYTAEIIIDLFTQKTIARNSRTIKFCMEDGPQTCIFYAGSISSYKKFFNGGK